MCHYISHIAQIIFSSYFRQPGVSRPGFALWADYTWQWLISKLVDIQLKWLRSGCWWENVGNQLAGRELSLWDYYGCFSETRGLWYQKWFLPKLNWETVAIINVAPRYLMYIKFSWLGLQARVWRRKASDPAHRDDIANMSAVLRNFSAYMNKIMYMNTSKLLYVHFIKYFYGVAHACDFFDCRIFRHNWNSVEYFVCTLPNTNKAIDLAHHTTVMLIYAVEIARDLAVLLRLFKTGAIVPSNNIFTEIWIWTSDPVHYFVIIHPRPNVNLN